MEKESINILHICNGFYGSKVHLSLYECLEKRVVQYIYIPLSCKYRGKQMLESDMLDLLNESMIINSVQLRLRHRILYKRKINTLLRDLLRINIDFNSVSLTHAATWCMDGALAYELYRIYKIPYVIAIRNTDVNIYFRYLKFYHSYFYEILKNASRIIFVSEEYRLKVIDTLLPRAVSNEVSDKMISISNGVDVEFIRNRKCSHQLTSSIRVLYLGNVEWNKNIHNVIKGIKIFKHTHPNYNLEYTVIGVNSLKNTYYQCLIRKYAKKHNWLKLKNRMPKEELVKNVSNYDIFIMTSFRETFGLVYVEALTQGLPIIYTKKQGFDNMYPEGYVGYHTDPNSPSEIAKTIKKVIDEYEVITSNIDMLSFDKYTWNEIANKYVELYNNILRNV